MDEFSILENALREYDNKVEQSDGDQGIEQECSHSEIVEERGSRSCIHCGQEVIKNITYEKEWRYYGADDTRHTSDPNRCQARKVEERSIFKDVENMGFSDKVVSLANELYSQVTKDKIYRGNSRKSIVFACIFHAYKIMGKPQSCDNLQAVFNLDRKIILKGMKHVNLNAPKNSEVRNRYITPVEIVDEIMDKLNANQEQKQEVTKLYDLIHNKSSILNRSKPQSVAAGLIYTYIVKTGRKIEIEEYTKIVNLSQLTITKIMKEIEKILSENNT